MSNKFIDLPEEDKISIFIDILNQEKRPPQFKYSNEDEEYELEQLLETVRAVKRLKDKEAFIDSSKNVISKSSKNTFNYRNITKIVAIASIILVVFTAAGIIPHINQNNQDNEFIAENAQENNNLFDSGNIAYAMMEAYNKLNSYSGTIEIRSEKDGELYFLETIDVKYKKPNKFTATHSYGGYSYTQISNGDKLMTIDSDTITIDYSNPERELWRYHILNQIQELNQASEINELGTETLIGRETMVYEYRFSQEESYHKMWVDKETKLPLKKEFNFAEGEKLINHFTEITINEDIEDSVFEYEPRADERVVELNSKISMEKLEEIFPMTKELIAAKPDRYSVVKTVQLKDEIYEYLIKMRDNSNEEFLDIYISRQPVSDYHFQGASHGKLDDGWVEYMNEAVNMFKVYIGKSNFAKWVTPEWEIVIISSENTNELIPVLEKASNNKMTPMTLEELENMGIKPTITKEGH